MFRAGPGSYAAAMAAKKKADAGDPRAEAFDQLRDILKRYAKKLDVKHDTPAQLYLNSKKPYKGKELFFGAVASRKSHVGYYLFPIYMFPEMEKTISPALMKRHQGKACFNFQRPDDAL